MTQPQIVLLTHVKHFIGPTAVHRLLREGMTVVCHDMAFADPAVREAFRAEVPGAEVCAATAPIELVAEIIDRFGRLDALVSNDPYPAVRAAVDEANPTEFRRAIEAMMVWPYTLIGRAAAQMKAQNGGRILIVSSAAPLTGIPNYSMYAIARGGANAMVPTLSKELARWNIPVNAIAANYIKNPDYFPPELLANKEAVAKMVENIPLGRLGEPEEVAELVALFASGRCGFVTGHVIPIAGGWA
ncbi:SDR family oxidoreductase [Ferrovibrio sp.]|uniref:SDR family oxidoreductase n=1 Tax=Ferrovibrio sp. TaxID=1917215 RepID=UPI0035AE4236